NSASATTTKTIASHGVSHACHQGTASCAVNGTTPFEYARTMHPSSEQTCTVRGRNSMRTSAPALVRENSSSRTSMPRYGFSASTSGPELGYSRRPSRMLPSLGKACIAVRITGHQFAYKNHTTLAAASAATTPCTQKSRLNRANANAATPLGVRGCHATGLFAAGLAKGLAGCVRNSSPVLGISSLRLGAGARRRVRRRHNHHRNRKPKLHHIIDQHFQRVNPCRGKLHIPKQRHRRGIYTRVFHRELHFALV